MYGNSTMTAPSAADDQKPIFDLTNSTNASRVYADFYDPNNPLRAGQWKPQKLIDTGETSGVYNTTQGALAPIATVIGGTINIYLYYKFARSPIVELTWSLYHPAGFTTLTWSGEKARTSTAWPSALMQKSLDGLTWTTVATEAAATLSTSFPYTWDALTAHSAVALGATYRNIRTYFGKTVTAIAGSFASFAVSDITMAIDTAGTPLIYFGVEEVNNYEEFRITNNTTGDYLEVSQQVPVGTVITIDTNNLTASLADGSPVNIRLNDESRSEWLPLNPGNNTLQYDEVGANSLTLTTTWEDRNL
jgi:hypothetical protein